MDDVKSWLQVGKSYLPTESLVPSNPVISSIHGKSNSTTDDERQVPLNKDKHIKRNEERGTDKKSRKDRHRKSKRKHKFDRKRSTPEHGESGNDTAPYLDYQKKESNQKHGNTTYSHHLQLDEHGRDELLKEYRKYREDFDDSSSEEEYSFSNKFPRLHDREKHLALECDTKSAFGVDRSSGDTITWTVDRKPDFDIPLFVGFRYFPLPENEYDKSRGTIITGRSRMLVDATVSKVDAIHKQNSSWTWQEYRALKANKAKVDTIPRESRYFGRNHRAVLTDPTIVHLKFPSKTKKKAEHPERFLLSSFLPFPIIEKDIMYHFENNSIAFSKETEESHDTIQLVQQSTTANSKAIEIARRFNGVLRENPGNAEACLSFANYQPELFRLQKEANGKYYNVIEKVRLVDQYLLENDRSVLERQVGIIETAIAAIKDKMNNEDSGHFNCLLLLIPLYCKLWNLQKRFEPPDTVLHRMQKSISDQPLVSYLTQQWNLYQKTVYSMSSYKIAKPEEEKFYTTYSEKIKNLIAIKQFSFESTDSNSNRRAFRHVYGDISQVNLDRFFLWLNYEFAYGHNEMMVALVQGMFLMNSPLRLLQDWKNNFDNVDKLEEFWDSEAPRTYGERQPEFFTLPPDDYPSIVERKVTQELVDIKDIVWEFCTEYRPDQNNFSHNALPESCNKDKESLPITDSSQPQLVYSRIHGHKIWIIPEDSRKTYQKILQEISSSNTIESSPEEPLENFSNQYNASHGGQATEQFNKLTDIYVNSYQKDFVASAVQYLPLRALLEKDSRAAELQPERVIIFDDMKRLLMPLKTAQSEVNEQFLCTHVKLLIYSLESLGIWFKNAVSSHHFLSRSRHDCMVNMDTPDVVSCIQDINLFWKNYECSSFHDSLKWASVVCSYRCRGNIIVHQRLLNQELVLHGTGYQTILRFCINLVEQVMLEYEQLSEISLSWKHSVLRRKFVSQLRSILIELLSAEGHVVFGNTHAHFSLKEKALARKNTKSKCLQLIHNSAQGQESVLSNSHDFLEDAVNSGSQSITRHHSCVGDLCNWATFLSSESLHSTNNMEALKFAHTVLQQINTASLETPLSAVDGVFTFYWHVVALVLQIPLFKHTAPSHVILSDTAFCRALKLIVQLGCSNALAYENTDDDHGNFGSFGYDGQWLDVGDVMGTADLTNNLCSYSLQKFHQSILLRLDEMNDKIQADRNRLKGLLSEKAIRIYDISQVHSFDQLPDLFHQVLLLAWGTFLSSFHFSRGNWNTAIMAGDAIFCKFVEVIRMILLNFPCESISFATDELNIATCFGYGMMHHNSSPQESQLVMCLEKLSQHRLQYLSYTYSICCGSHSLPHLKSAVWSSLKDFPFSPPLLDVWTTLNMISVSGYLTLRSYWRDIINTRLPWGGGITVNECWFEIQAELIHIIKVSKQILIDPCGGSIKVKSEKNFPCIENLVVPDWQWLLQNIQWQHWSEDKFSRLENILERMVSNPNTSNCPYIWRIYWMILYAHHYQSSFTFKDRIYNKISYLNEAKKVALRGIQSCGYCKALYMDMLGPLRAAFSDKELLSITQLMEEQGIFVRC